jgi:hypothetical protein
VPELAESAQSVAVARKCPFNLLGLGSSLHYDEYGTVNKRPGKA